MQQPRNVAARATRWSAQHKPINESEIGREVNRLTARNRNRGQQWPRM